MKFKKLSLAFAFTLPLLVNANDLKEVNTQFKEAYHQYQAAIKTTDKKKQLEYAKLSYDLGKQVYGEQDINTARLGFNLASIYNNTHKPEQARKVLAPLIEIYKTQLGKYHIELVDLYFAYAKSLPYKKNDMAERYYKKALTVIDEQSEKDPLLKALITLDAGIELLAIGSRKSKMILDAQEYLIEQFPANDKRVVKANFYAGKYYLARKSYGKSVENFESNLAIFEALKGPTHPLELNTHAFLINALEKSGKSDEATKHCIAIGKMRPWDDDQEQRPLYRANPEYPNSMARARQNGSVKIEFTISDFGFVTDAKIINPEESKRFHKVALAALDKWRYAPKFENGVAVEAKSTVQLDFTIAR